MSITIVDLSAYGLVGIAIGMELYAGYLFNMASEDLAHDIVKLFF